MRLNFLSYGTFVLAIISIVFVSGCVQQAGGQICPPAGLPQPPGCEGSSGLQNASQANGTSSYTEYTFTVTVPSNTPAYTTIFWEPVTNDGLTAGSAIPMNHETGNVWTLTLKKPARENYRYNRNDWGFAGAEEFSPDLRTAHRTIKTGAKTVDDVVEKWRWLPEGDYNVAEIPTKAKETTFVARVDDEKFQKGVEFADFWASSMKNLLNTTHASLKESNVKWIEVAPAWDCVKTTPLPVISRVGYTDEEINFHLKKMKDDGFKVLLSAGNGCSIGDANPSEEWWNEWFRQYENYTMYFVDLANKYDVEQLVITGDQAVIGSSQRPGNYKERLEQIYSKAKQAYKGKLGRMFVLSGQMDIAFIWPNPKDAPFMENWDFITINFWISQTTNNNPTQEELYSNVKAIFDKHLKPLYNTYKKPIVLGQVAYQSIGGSLAGISGADDAATSVWEPYSNKFALDLAEQAMGYEAVMKNAAETNYIIGTYAFAYWPDEFPLTKEYNVRGKPAEKVLKNWYQSIP